MAKALVQAITNQISTQDVRPVYTLTIDSTDYTAYLLSWSISNNIEFGSAAATFTLNNDTGLFGEGGANKIDVGDIVSFVENYGSDTTNWKRFYGKVEQRSISKSSNDRTITLTCLDYISVLQQWDIDLECEGTKIKIENETLTPNYLNSPNDMFAQVFNFANDAIASQPAPIFTFRDKNHLTEDPQNDGFSVIYSSGQVKLGSVLNARDNYDFVALSYYCYTQGIYAEDVLEQILTLPNGYNTYLFDETSAQAVIDNHLRTTYYAEEGAVDDVMTPNYIESTITIKHQLSSAVSAGDTNISLVSVEGLPTSGQAEINGDIFTWSSISGNVLLGVPATGSYALKAHAVDSYVAYEHTYDVGQIWYLSYSNLITDLTSLDFYIPGGTFSYLDKRFGRIILNGMISVYAAVKCVSDYSFSTLQTSGIELNSIKFRSRELDNRYEAIQKLRQYLAPNYIIRTQGDDKIWASLLTQKVTADYTLSLIENLNYLEDQDLYTRVVMYGKNKNPTNLMFNSGVDFVTTGQSYKALASQTTLSYESEVEGWQKYKTLISDAGYITLESIKPIVYINNIPIDDQLHQMIAQPIKVKITTTTTTTVTEATKKEEAHTESRTAYYYQVLFPHVNLEPNQTIYLYDSQGNNTLTIAPSDVSMDYARGIYYLPGSTENAVAELLSTATYYVFYSTRNLELDYDNARFKINKALIPDPTQVLVTATFEYWTVFTPLRGIAAIMDGRWDTQAQTEFYSEPPNGYNYAILDLGAIKTIQAMDLVAGFFKPDETRKIDIDMRLTLQYSTDNVDYYDISDATHNFQLIGGQSISFEENDFGIGFEARYIKILLENVKNVQYKTDDGVYPVAFTEISIYDDIILKAETTLIPATTLTQTVTSEDAEIPVVSTATFTEPESGETATAYINEVAFTYTGLTDTSFIGCILDSGTTGGIGDRVSQTVETDSSIYDDSGIRAKLGDRLKKDMRINDDYLYTSDELTYLSKRYLLEYLKNHSKVDINILFAPHLKVGQTIALTDTYNDVDAINYFIESISENSGKLQITAARYP